MTNGSISDPESKKLSPNRKRNNARYELSRANSPLTRLGVSLQQYRDAPKITPILREIRGGKQLALKAMRFSETECIKEFLAKHDSISTHDREKLSLEAIALSADIDIRHLWGEIQFAMREYSVNSVKAIAVGNHPEIIKKRVEYALTPGGFRDRDALDIMLGALPTPKNTTNFINKVFTGGARDSDEPDPSSSPATFDDDVDVIFPDVSVMQEKVQPMRQKALPGK